MLSVADIDQDRFWGKVNKTNDCWLWTAGLRLGYGQFWTNGYSHLAHRISYLLAHGALPPKELHIDHLCRVRNCVNPEHLEAVTPKVNILRGEGLSAKKARQTHCLQGHPLSGLNLYKDQYGYRQCKACKRWTQACRDSKRWASAERIWKI